VTKDGAGLPVVGIDSPRRDMVATARPASSRRTIGGLLGRSPGSSDDDLRRRMGRAAALAAEDYDIDRTSARVEEHYQTLLANTRAPRSSRWEATWRQIFDRLT
jgi:hypothetical protein